MNTVIIRYRTSDGWEGRHTATLPASATVTSVDFEPPSITPLDTSVVKVDFSVGGRLYYYHNPDGLAPGDQAIVKAPGGHYKLVKVVAYAPVGQSRATKSAWRPTTGD